MSFTRLHADTITSRWTSDRGTWLPGHLYLTLKNGPALLEPAVQRRRVAELRRRYAVMLLKSVARGRLLRDSTFRTYHRGALCRLHRISSDTQTSVGLGLALFGWLLNARWREPGSRRPQ